MPFMKVVCYHELMSYFWAVAGYLRSYISDFASLVLVLAGLLYAMMPARVAEAERNKKHRIWGAVFVVIGIAGFGFGLSDKAENKRQMETMLAAARTQATEADMKSLRDELGNLRRDTNSGFDSIVAAFNSAKSLSTKPLIKRTPVMVPLPQENQVALGPGIVQHVQVSQQRTVSNRDDAKFALQVTIQTDVPTQPTAFMIECNGDIEDGHFFLAGQAVMMGVGYGVQPDKKSFYLRFAFPAFTPESPIVVTLLSKTDIRVLKVSKAN